MFSITNINDQPIAFIKGGKYDGDVVYLHDNLDKDVKNTFSEIDLRENTKNKNAIIYPVFNKNSQRQIYYVCGPSGTGKSSYSSMLVKSYHKLYPNHNIFYVSATKIENDPAYKDEISFIKQIPNDKLDLFDISKSDKMNNSLFIFDDCIETIQDKKVQESIYKLITMILQLGRKQNISCIITSHLINPNNKLNRILMNEIQFLVIFRGCNKHAVKYVLKTYFGFDGYKIRDIIDEDETSRYVLIHKTFPNYIITQKRIYD